MRCTPDSFPQIANPNDFQTAVTDAMAEFQVEETTAERFLLLGMGLAVIYDEVTAQTKLGEMVAKAAADKEPWGTQWVASMLRKHSDEHRTVYQKAIELGIDPVAALRLTAGLNEEQASTTVAILRAEGGDQ
ncbi:hypothetical protein OG730_41875 (plasmid) [Streptomyces sp. NBC_01298]|uniref:hypothetical protein n=1 Tax=Streptomyces sp. NBC_01298 TaxID=2903817 RepID=UPI002E162CBE|nr:hypothetical protein OG730_41875 [Streptomyces sp. NBC_01298]